MTNYVKNPTWVDGVGGGTPVSAAKLNNIEDGIYDAHFQPCARAYHNAAQSISHNSLTVVAFNSERFDTDTIHDTVTDNSRLTCKTAGKYMIGGGVEWASAVTNSILDILLNGATVIGGAYTVGDQRRIQVSTLYELAVNDYVELAALQTNGGSAAMNINASGNYSPEFWIVRVA